MNRLLGIAVLIAVISPLATASFTEGFKVPAGSAPWAIMEWSRQSEVQVLFDYTDLSHYRTRSLYGVYGAGTGLQRMLIDCPFDIAEVDSRTMVVIRHLGPKICKPWLGAGLAPVPPCTQQEVS